MRVLVHGAADAVPAEVGVDPVPAGAADLADRRGDVAHPRAGPGCRDAGGERPLGGLDEPLVPRVWVPIWNVSAESATQPWTCAAKSMLSTSPSARTWSDGRPCSAASFTEVHSTPGYGMAPNDGW